LRVGLLGGTFNPPHIAHMVCAEAAYEALGLDVVRFLVAGVPPHKEVPDDPGAEVRLELCEAAVKGDERFEVSRAELDRPGPSFTVDTLLALHDDAPGDELSFIVGGDMAFSLPTWREPARVLSLARLAVAEREGVRRDDIAERLESALPGSTDRVDFFDMPRIDLSSSMIRRRVAEGLSVRYLVGAGVASVISSKGLYAR
jgi:nicotinate-nucleotide adenylyltransferase